jgi:hypothetical protein
MVHEITNILAAIGVFGLPMFIVWLVVRANAKKLQSQHDLIRVALELGKDISPELLLPPQPRSRKGSRHSRLVIGIILISVGLALAPIVGLQAGYQQSVVGLLFILPGAGLLLADYLIKRDSAKQ